MSETVLITGASGGIGAALARCFATRGYSLILVARSAEPLAALAANLRASHGIDTTVLTVDLAAPNAAETLVQSLGDRPVDILVNNAGFATFGPLAAADLPRTEEEIRLNVTTLTSLTRLLLPGMLARKRGRILNVASTAAFFPGPFMAVYYATKAYVLSFSLALREECRGTGVTVTCLCPGPTKTNFVSAAKMESSPLFRVSPLQTPQAVAECGVSGCLAGRTIVFPSLWNRLQTVFGHFVPRQLQARIVRRVQAPA